MSEFPSFYEPGDVGHLYEPRMEEVIKAGLTTRISTLMVKEMSSSRWNAMLAIDPQVGFVLPGYPLSVKGAVHDVRRVIELIYDRPELFDEIFVTLDQHLRLSIFSRYWWKDQTGNFPPAFTRITTEEVEAGNWQPIIMETWSHYYVQKMGYVDIWPDHCLIGTEQAQLVPALEEAIWWHTIARNTKPIALLKGDVLESEFYGPFGPNVRVPGHPRGGLITQALDLLGRYQKLFVWGEARDFCVLSGLLQHLEYYEGRPEVISRVYLIKDCTSLVFPNRENENNEILEEMVEKGMKIITSDQILAGDLD